MPLQQVAKVLGYAGLVPFIVFSIGSWLTLSIVNPSHFILHAYAAVILSFMGAVHWGVAMSRESDIANGQLTLSVVPALIGWLALMMPLLTGYGLLIIAFIGLYLYDRFIARRGLLPEWYVPMRTILTSVVVVCLVIAAMATFR